MDARRKQTQKRTDLFREHGYVVIEKWGCEFRQEQKDDRELIRFVVSRRPAFFRRTLYRPQTEAQIVDAVKNDVLFGMLEVDLKVPEQWSGAFRHSLPPRDYFAEMCPFMGNTEVDFKVIGEHMQDHVKVQQLKEHVLRGGSVDDFVFKEPKPRRLLVGVMDAEKILVSTPLLKWYLEHGIICTKIYQVIEFQKSPCFKKFCNEVTEARRSGDADPDQAIVGDTMKLLGNSAYGSLLLDKEKHQDVKYVKGEQPAKMHVKMPRFKAMTELGEGMFELQLSKESITMTMPSYVGFHILQLAKLRVLEFYYDCLDKWCDRKDWEMCETDTDSLYIAMSRSSFQEIIKPEYQSVFLEQTQKSCHLQDVDPSKHWFPRTCCATHKSRDKRTPGLFKVEWIGDEMVCLASKTYACRGDDVKFSSKGLQKDKLTDVFERYLHVLKTGESYGITNTGFRAKDNTIFTYSQFRRGLGYFYCKRVVDSNGRTASPLPITLKH